MAQPTQAPQAERQRAWRIVGWLVVAGAALVAALSVILISGSSGPNARQRSAAGGHGLNSRSGQSFHYCAHRAAVFTGHSAFVGLTDPLVETYSSERGCALGLLAADHIGYFRGVISWPQVQPTPGTYNFAPYDQLVTQLAQHHIRFLPGLLGSPRWISTGPAGGKRFASYPPADPTKFASFAASCVRRYGPGGSFWRAHPKLPYYPVLAWQIWNEPNLVQSWRPRTNAAAYVRLLRSAYRAIKAVDPHATVVTAGMPFFTAGRERSFLTQLFRAGMVGSFDALAIHSYSPTQAPQRLELARQIMDRFGAQHAQLWATELAWASGPPDPWAVNPHTQASAISSFFDWVARSRVRLGLREVMWYSLEDHVYGPDPSWWGYHLGLLTLRRQPKPSLDALGAAAKRFDQ